jgi:predicted RNA binding protein YcfA (HicA-like mRNA interferase family)
VKFQPQPGISRQARKTIDAIKTTECVPTKSVHRLLECLGFKRGQTGSHQTWRHPKGYRVTLVNRCKDDGIWGHEIKKVRDLLTEIEIKERGGKSEMGMMNEKTKEKLSGADVRNLVDNQVLAEKRLPNLTKIDLSNHEQRTMIKNLSDAFNEQAAYLQRLGSMVQSVQEYLIELGVKVENGQITEPVQPAKPVVEVKPKLTPEERKAKFIENGKRTGEKRKAEAIAKIKTAQKNFPQLAKNYMAIAAIAGSCPATVKKYYKEGLV